jgi:arylsulfatase A-like enzyme
MGQRSQAVYLQRPAEEFYDLRNDPDELVNLADTSRPPRPKRMKRRAQRHPAFVRPRV